MLNKFKMLFNKLNIKRKNKLSQVNNKTEKINYETLLPKNDVENKSKDMLDFAIREKNVNNIAITGGYSSGKSSIINSYFKYIKGVKIISLATFKQKKKDTVTLNKNNGKIKFDRKDNTNVIIQEVEKTILEKMYYSSYAYKINSKDYYKIALTAIIFYIFFMITNNIIRELLLQLNIFNIVLSSIILQILVFLVIYYLIRKISDIKSIKIKLGDIEIDTTTEKRNILNENLEMILEIIKEANYKYIIFEDLDRFECPDIFEHLRDLNININSVSVLKEPVKFIYAIKDDMFTDENRTKFFDIIYPVVPYVSYENSGIELYKIIEDYKLTELDQDFITKVCLFISDMRILKNALNEYVVYKKELDNKNLSVDTLFYKNLFAMMLYKNTCSKDFTLLQQHDGVVYNIFNNLNKHREEEKEKIRDKIESYNIEEENINKNIKKNKKEFIDELIKQIKNKYPNDTLLKYKEESNVTIQLDMDRKIFENYLLSPEFKIYHYNNGTRQWIEMPKFLVEFLPDINTKFLWLNHNENIKLQDIQTKLQEYKILLKNSESFNIKELISIGNTTILKNVELGKYSLLVRYLISEGYINENYSNYISRFSEGSIRANDNAYIISVRSREKLPFNANIDTPNKVIKMLEEEEFKREEILNKTILDTLLENAEHETKLQYFIEILQSNQDYIKILLQCILENNFKNKSKLLNKIFNTDKSIWSKIENFIQNEEEKGNYTQDDEQRQTLIEAILENIDINILKESKEKKLIEETISNNNISINNKNLMTEILNNFNIKYKDIALLYSLDEKIDEIISTNSYEINKENILTIITIKEAKKIEKSVKVYEYIQSLENVGSYIDENINDYITNVFMKLENKQSDSEECIVHLFGLEQLDQELIEKILDKETETISNIENINIEIWDILLSKQKVKPLYNNLNSYYKEYGLNDVLIDFINNIENIKLIATLNENEAIENYLDKELVKDIISENEISISIYEEIISNTKIRYKHIEVSNLDEEKTLYLMEKEIFKFNMEMYNKIRNCNTNVFIKYTKKYIRNIQGINIKDINYNLEEINNLIISNIITNTLKKKAIKNIKEEDVENISIQISDNISNFILRNNIHNSLSYNSLIKILKLNYDVDSKVKLVMLNILLVKLENIEQILRILGENYIKIIKDRTTPSFKDTIYNEFLIKAIKKMGYNIDYTKENGKINLRGTKRGNPAA